MNIKLCPKFFTFRRLMAYGRMLSYSHYIHRAPCLREVWGVHTYLTCGERLFCISLFTRLLICMNPLMSSKVWLLQEAFTFLWFMTCLAFLTHRERVLAFFTLLRLPSCVNSLMYSEAWQGVTFAFFTCTGFILYVFSDERWELTSNWILCYNV